MNERGQQLDDFVEAYEVARESGRSHNVADFIPPIDHPQRHETIVELVRVDLEYSWREGQGKRLEQYRHMFPEALSEGDGLRQVAFEEYRLRRWAGEDVSPDIYSQIYTIPTDDWPVFPLGESGQSDSRHEWTDSGLRELSRVDAPLANRLAAATRRMPRVGERFENFHLVGELGRGAFGRVYLARQNDLARRFVALKITPQVSQEPQRLAQLQHTNIVPIYSVHCQGNLQAICMPFLGPNTLADVLKTFELSRSLPVSGKAIVSTIGVRPASTIVGDSELPDAEETTCERYESIGTVRGGESIRHLGNMSYLHAVVWIMARVADGLTCAHEHSIVHRDLKPANILLTDDGEPLILDFNLSTHRSAVDTTAALIGGTLPYIAPEHITALRNGGDVGPQADVYSLGAILFQLLTGRLPYPLRKGSFDEIVAQMLSDRRLPAPAIRSLNPAVSPGLEAIVDRCLAADPQQRYATARDVHEDLQRHLDNRPLRHAPNRSLVERFQKWMRRHPRLTSATTVALLGVAMVIALASMAWTRGSRLAASHAREMLHQLDSDLESARTALNSPFVDNQELDDAVDSATAALDRTGVTMSSNLDGQAIGRRLDIDERRHLQKSTAELLYLLAGGKAQQAVRSSAAGQRTQLLEESLALNARVNVALSNEHVPTAFKLQRARLLAAAGRTEESEQLLQQLESAANDEVDLRTLAFERAKQHDFEEAVTLLEQLIREVPHDHTLWFCLGSCYLSIQQYAKAEQSFTTAVSLKPQFTSGYEHRGLARLLAGKYQEACGDFDTVLEHLPDFPAAFVNRALACQELGRTDEALRDLTDALEIGSTQTRIYFIRARLRSRMGDVAGADDDYREGMRRTPCDELSWVARGVARISDQPHEALADFRQALRLNPCSQTALQNMAHVFSERLADPGAAVDVLDKLVEFAPHNATALASRGVLLARQGHRETAVRDADKAVEVSHAPLIIYQAGCIYALLSTDHEANKRRAVQLIAQALQADAALVEMASQDQDLSAIRDDSALRSVLSAARLLHETGAGQRTQ